MANDQHSFSATVVINLIGYVENVMSFMDEPLGLIRYHIMASPYYGNISYKIYQKHEGF